MDEGAEPPESRRCHHARCPSPGAATRGLHRYVAQSQPASPASQRDRTSTHAAYCPDGSWFVLTRQEIHVILTRAPAQQRVQVPLPGAQRMQQLLSWSGTGALQEETAELAGVDVLVLLAEGGTHR